MEKVFYFKRYDALHMYQINLSSYVRETDYKLILRICTRDKHKNFIESCMSSKTAYNILSYYFITRANVSIDTYPLYKKLIEKIGSIGLSLFIEFMNDAIEKVIMTNSDIFILNELKK